MNKYMYIEADNCFESIKFDISELTNKEVISTYGKLDGISNIIDYNYLLNKFERNTIEMETKGFLAYLSSVFYNPVFLFQVKIKVIFRFIQHQYGYMKIMLFLQLSF